MNERRSLPALALVAGVFACTMQCLAQDADAEKGGITVEPKYFEPAKGGQGGIGFAYKVAQNLGRPYASGDETSFRVLNLDFKAEGNVAFNPDINPTDFLKTGLDFNLELSRAEAQQLGPDCDLTKVSGPELDRCLEEARRSASGAALRVQIGAIGSLESDQQFDKRAWTYGGHITARYRPAANSLVNQLNPLDWPFRLTRKLTKHPDSGAIADAFPTVRLALERVTPQKDTAREAVLGRKDEYNRANLEVAMSTAAAMVKGQAVKFEWSWRYFKELNAEQSIKDAGLDRFLYAAASLRLDSGWRLTHARGRLPLDRQSDKVWELGYKVDLK